ncbi:MAG: 23S rRNA (adenine(2030)-N(6))-methyltransferase RlmJ [Kiritimatiellaeota bacterium]|nr:23S rRNA (adenine(2030)-N(6))-methyltransferase RlmJ [Kiritimatiellota bacterium]
MNRHFAKLGDVWKHLLLAEVLRLNPPLRYWETHAGSATYPLNENSPRLHGALRFLSHAHTESQLARCAYLQVLRTMPGTYPGSSLLAIRVLGKNASYVFCDIDPDSSRSLREVATDLDVRVIAQDGVSTIAREAEFATFDPSGVLVHIDPFEPHERMAPDSMTPVELAASLARKGFRIFYWYGYDEVAKRGWARSEISSLAPGVDLWCGDVLIPAPFVYPERSGVWGCGVVLANMTPEEVAACSILGHALERVSADDMLKENDPPRLTFGVI